MKVFFTASQRGKKNFNAYYKKIYHYLEELDFRHLDKGLITSSIDQFYKELKKQGEKRLAEFYRNNIKNIKNADIVVFECSFPSLSIGFMIQKALEINKPVVVLYLKNHDPYFLEGIKEEKLILVEYTSETLKKLLRKTMKRINPLIDTRFNFFISPKLLTYLQQTSKEESITKSAFLRRLILEHMKKQKSQAEKEN